MPISPEVHGLRRKTEVYEKTNTNLTNKQVVFQSAKYNCLLN